MVPAFCLALLNAIVPLRKCFKARGRNEFTGTTDFQSVAWCYSTDWKSVVQIADGKFYPAARPRAGSL